jgi:hypothetical protein
MKMQLVYPSWPQAPGPDRISPPPHGPVVFAAEVPPEVELQFIDENVQDWEPDPTVDLAAVSVMLTSQLPRALAIAAEYRRLGIPGDIRRNRYHAPQ